MLDELSENAVQRAVFTHLRTRGAHGIVAFHPRNGGQDQRGRRRGINSGLGVLSGIPDVIIIQPELHRGNLDPGSRVFALELKRTKGKLSDAQVKVLAQLEAAGVTVGVAHGLDHAIAWLEGNGLLKGRAA